VPITEQSHAVEAFSEMLLAKAAREAAHWPESVRLSFNLSTVELCSAASAARILHVIRRHGLEPARLQIEITETALLADFEAARHNLQALRKAGVRIVLDDFGAGFASISYLRELAFDAIKLDGALVTDGARTAPGLRLLKGVLDMCASLDLPCVAEHIESAEQLALLRRLGCRDGQGYALSPPLDPEAARAMAGAKLVPFPLHSALAKPHRAA
jgi:EAL domain-containing protein (putative c-di-GMP-specific phosphodiesterase class I)